MTFIEGGWFLMSEVPLYFLSGFANGVSPMPETSGGGRWHTSRPPSGGLPVQPASDRNPLLLTLTELPLLLSDVPLSTFVSVGSREAKGNGNNSKWSKDFDPKAKARILHWQS